MAEAEAGGAPQPRSTPDLTGHAAAEATFLDAFLSGRPHHAWLIAGPRGIGKATLAFRIARFVLRCGATVPAAAPATGLHVEPGDPVFRRVAAAGHADLLTVERTVNEKTNKLRKVVAVDDVRRISGFLHLTSAEGGWRVVVVDSADEMSRESANAILKILEEPPARSLLLLLCHNPGSLLPTIRSRCRRLQLQPLAEEDIVALLRRRQPGIADADAQVLAQLADGSAGRAVRMAEEGGAALFRGMVDLLATLPDLDVQRLHAFADRLGGASAEPAFRMFADLLPWWLNRAVRAGQGAPVAFLPGEAEVARRVAAGASLDRLLALWEKMTHLFDRTEAVNLERKQVTLDVVLALQGALRASPGRSA